MIYVVITLLILINISIIVFFIWVGRRLNKYISYLEGYIEKLEERVEFCENILVTLKVKDKKIIRRNLLQEED